MLASCLTATAFVHIICTPFLTTKPKLNSLQTIRGFHGTAQENVTGIKVGTFRLSEGPYEWLGDGVYFFIEGICDPVQAAMEWAAVHSFRNKQKRYDRYSVLSVNVATNDVLDLRKEKELKLFNELRSEVETRHANVFKRHKKEESDKLLIDLIHQKFGFDAIICNLYIRNRAQLEIGVHSRIPNTTVLAVRNVGIIDMATLTVEQTGGC